MKNNLAVTDHEVVLKENIQIVTRADNIGLIIHANRYFIRISNYSKAEHIGKSHNIVRHPDIFAHAFQNLWNDFKAKRPWAGLVKNRYKKDDFSGFKPVISRYVKKLLPRNMCLWLIFDCCLVCHQANRRLKPASSSKLILTEKLQY